MFHFMRNNKTYKCSICGNIITLNHESSGKLVCCNKNMDLLKANYDESGSGEKHVPVLQKIDNETYKIIVGAIPHPMTEEHYIEYIEVSTNKNERLTFFLNKNEKAEVIFKTSSEILSVFAYCNLHGMWGKKL